LVEVACWAHTRRHFHRALDTDSARMGAVLAYIAHLDKVEKRARRSGIVGEDLRLLREHASKPVLERLHEYLKKIREEVLPKSEAGQAMQTSEREPGSLVMGATNSNVLVFFGATGDLAFKQIFPALQSLVKRHGLDIPIIGVAFDNWTLDQLKARARDSLLQNGGVDEEAFGKLSGLLRYVDVDYRQEQTYTQWRQALGQAQRPLHYLAIPPSMFATVAEGLAKSGCAQGRARGG